VDGLAVEHTAEQQLRALADALCGAQRPCWALGRPGPDGSADVAAPRRSHKRKLCDSQRPWNPVHRSVLKPW